MLDVKFYATEKGNEPVRSWLKELSLRDRKTVGGDIQTVQYRWPLGMPLVGNMKKGLWEVRSNVSDKCIARVFFVIQEGTMILLHGIKKKDQKTPKVDLDTARSRLEKFER